MSTTVLITGANKGIGYETARQLAALGWTVLVGARDPERGRTAAEKLGAEGGDVRYIPLDVTDDASVDAAAGQVAAITDHLDVLVNNAGTIGAATAPLETGPADFLACFGVNLLGPVRVTRAFLPLLSAAALPRVVMVSSGMGSLTVTSDPDRLESQLVSLVYPASKAALNMVTTQYAKALPGWKVNAVDPGYTATDLNGHSGHKTVADGARVVVDMATVGPDGPTGAFVSDEGTVPW
ncbi:MAG: SDR family NAD(P)-dependent oxidoreductase [Acidimicrobiales bacterium]|nr:SDR family NAD(P)-dependent oxidoreductase [Acidimicrobiales bacterium]